MKNKSNLIWIDLEMTGLNPEYHRIIEIATIITDTELNILAEGPVLAINQSDAHIALMNDWNRRVHTKNQLINRVKRSLYNERLAELKTLDFLKKWVDPNSSPICGNSIAQDRRFLFKYMPELENYFHYRYLDVSTLKELVRMWKPEILKGYQHLSTNHQALEDIKISILELNYYRKYLFNNS